MSDFQQVRRKGPVSTGPTSNNPTIKYPEKHQTLIEMGFDTFSICQALDSTNGDLEAATAVLLEETSLSLPDKDTKFSISNPSKSTASKQTASSPPKLIQQTSAKSSESAKEVHNKFMASYKVQKCKEKANHDKRMCIYWHTKNDRRRNPFEIPYTCTECGNCTETTNCESGDSCLKSHNMLERMFHPELFKISMCQRGPNGSHCERGNLCAFAHSEEDHRVPLSVTNKQNAATTANTANGNVNNQNSATAVSNAESILPGKIMSDSRILDNIQEKLIKLIKSQGSEGIISSELPKRFSDIYSERLEITDEAGEKFRIKDLLLSHPCITVTMHKGVQPKYVYDETKMTSSEDAPEIVTPVVVAPSFPSSLVNGSISYSSIITNSSNNNNNSNNSNNNNSSNSNDPSDADLATRARRRGPAPGLELSSDNSNSDVSKAITGDASSLPRLDYSMAVTNGLNSLGGRRRGPDYTAVDEQSTTTTVTAPTSLSEFTDRLNHANSNCTALQLQVSNLQDELKSKSIEYETQNSKLKTILLQLSEYENKQSYVVNKNDSLIGELKLYSIELESLKKQLHDRENEISMKNDELRKKDIILNRLKQEKSVDMNQFRISISQVENALIEIQQKESIYINEISLHDTINESSRARDEVTKFVNMIKVNLTKKIASENNNNNVSNNTSNNSNNNNLNFLNSMNSNTNNNIMLKPVNNDFNNDNFGSVATSPLRVNNAQNHFIGKSTSPQTQQQAFNSHNIMSPFLMLNEEKNDILSGSGSLTSHFNSLIDSSSSLNIEDDSYLVGISNHQPDILICALNGCNKEGSFICSACGKAGYCGPEHQREHWVLHMNECRI